MSEDKKDKAELKTLSMRIPKEIWAFYKTASIIHDKTMQEVVIKVLERNKKLVEKRERESIKIS